MWPGGASFDDEETGSMLPLRVDIERREPFADLAVEQAAAWQRAAGPIYRLRLSESLVRRGEVVYVAVAAEHDIGYLHVRSGRRNFVTCVRLWVAFSCRRRRVGSRLVEAVVLRELNPRRPHLLAQVPSGNRVAIQFFEHCGFQAGATIGQGRWSVVEYAKTLPRDAA